MNILYVDDNYVNRLIAGKMLGKYYSIDSVETANEAFELVKQKFFEVIMIDLNLNDPMIDGFGVLSHLKLNQQLNDALFIAHTNYIGDIWEKKCMDAGFDYFMPKPIDIAIFQAVINNKKNG